MFLLIVVLFGVLNIKSVNVLVSNSTTQFHLVLSTYQAGFSLHKILGFTSVMYYYLGTNYSYIFHLIIWKLLDEVSEEVNVFFFCRTVVPVMFLLQVTSWDNPLAAEVFWETKSVSAIAVLVSKSTTQFHLALSSYRIAPLSTTWRCPHTKLVFHSTKFWAIRPSCKNSNGQSSQQIKINKHSKFNNIWIFESVV
jgi:hypothetical protein